MTPTVEERLQQYRAVLDEAAASLNRNATSRSGDDNVVPLLPRPSRTRVLAVGAVAAALIAGAVGVVAWRVGSDSTETPITQPAVTTPPTRPPTSTALLSPVQQLEPYLLIDGWNVVRYAPVEDWNGVDAGTPREMTFERDSLQLEVFWYTDELESILHEWNQSFWQDDRTVAGRPAKIFQTSPSRTEFVAVWRDGSATIEVKDQGSFDSNRQGFLEALPAIRRVDRAEFEAALPAGSRAAPGTGPELSSGVPTSTTPPGPPVRQLTPFILFDGWIISEAQEWVDWDGQSSSTARELVVSRREQELDVYWYALDDHQDKLDDRSSSAFRVTDYVIFGHPAQITQYSRRNSEFSALWRDGDVTMEVVSVGDSIRTRKQFLRVLDSMRMVDRAEFEAALPPGSDRGQENPVTTAATTDG